MIHGYHKQLLDKAKTYSPYTIFWKQPFCISPCDEKLPAQCDLIIVLHPERREKCDRNFENRLTYTKVYGQK